MVARSRPAFKVPGAVSPRAAPSNSLTGAGTGVKERTVIDGYGGQSGQKGTRPTS